MDCGPTCLQMIAQFYGKRYSLDYIRSISNITRKGVSLASLSEAAEKIGLEPAGIKLSAGQLAAGTKLPCILHWNRRHFVVLYRIAEAKRSIAGRRRGLRYHIADPGHGLISMDEDAFLDSWLSPGTAFGFALLTDPTPGFFAKDSGDQTDYGNAKFLFQYLIPYRKYILQIFSGMLLGSLLSLILPFLTQGLVDYGIKQHNIRFLYLILQSLQLLLFLGSAVIDMIRNWILLHINIRISVTIISRFLVKLMRLPLYFFESERNIGDITQRINDHNQVESFLTSTALNTFFSIINLLIFSVVLGYYDIRILAIFLAGSCLSVAWLLFFLDKRRRLNYIRFQCMRENQNSIYELINGMQEIKLNNCEKTRRWDWERVQSSLFELNSKSLSLEQWQEMGSSIMTQVKNILISFTAAMAVIHNQITLGMMLSISYIVGQLNAPLTQLILFIRNIQDAKLSLNRLSEIHQQTR